MSELGTTGEDVGWPFVLVVGMACGWLALTERGKLVRIIAWETSRVEQGLGS
jgi:hypothetical protein